MRSGYMIPTFAGPNKWAELHSRGSPQEGSNQKWLHHITSATSPLRAWGSPIKGTKSKGLHHPYLLEEAELSRIATSPLHSPGSPQEETK